mmetsp:Transcript_11197/g.39712  ORF Transcript_11197/g.39712 Transcript_11197/m.39712 type:complete len:316 (+) Transcript_11197:69-1016(+)
MKGHGKVPAASAFALVSLVVRMSTSCVLGLFWCIAFRLSGLLVGVDTWVQHTSATPRRLESHLWEDAQRQFNATLERAGLEDSFRTMQGNWLYQVTFSWEHIAFSVVVFVLQYCCCCVYWGLFIRDTPSVYVRPSAVLLPHMRGRWHFYLFGCCGDASSCLKVVLCNSYAIAEMWYRLGVLTAMFPDLRSDDPAGAWFPHAWQFFAGFGGYVLWAEGCESCLGLVIRHGACQNWCTGAVMPPGVRSLRDIYELPRGDPELGADCLAECCCYYCAAVQDFRHALLAAELQIGATHDGNAPDELEGVSLVGKPVQIQ